MQPRQNDTIVAIATAAGRGGVGVIRVSGHRLAGFAEALTRKPCPAPRLAQYTAFYAEDGSAIDDGLLLSFVAPKSFTGEDVLELQGHGGPVVLNMLLKRCLSLGARLAEPGEFTRRAFLNDKLDLAQAESVADLIDAASEAAAKSAVRSLQGEFSREVAALQAQLTNLRMLIEATLDFPEEDLDFLSAAKALEQLAGLQTKINQVLATAQQGALLREGMQIVLVGQPNVGKSSLLNALAGEEVAIVTAIAGTTRDTVREHIQLDGVPIHVIDTAGLRDTDDPIEKIGIARTWQAIAKADLALLLVDAQHGVGEAEAAILAALPSGLSVMTVENKIDLMGDRLDDKPTEKIRLSAKTGAGIPELRRVLLEKMGWQGASEGVFLARTRHVHALQQAVMHLDSAQQHYPQLEVMAEELRLAQGALSTITGEMTADDLLGEIFSRFCIGK